MGREGSIESQQKFDFFCSDIMPKKMHQILGDFFLLKREDLFEIGVKEKVFDLLDKYKAVARSTKDKVCQVSNHFKRTRVEQKNAKLIEVIKLNNSKNFYNFIKSKPKTPTKNDIQK